MGMKPKSVIDWATTTFACQIDQELELKLEEALKPLTIRERKFCWLYLKYGNKTKALTESGFKTNDPACYASLLSKETKIAHAIQILLQVSTACQVADLTERAKILTGIARGVVESTTSGVGPRGHVDLRHTSNADRVRAIAELNAMDRAASGGSTGPTGGEGFRLNIVIAAGAAPVVLSGRVSPALEEGRQTIDLPTPAQVPDLVATTDSGALPVKQKESSDA